MQCRGGAGVLSLSCTWMERAIEVSTVEERQHEYGAEGAERLGLAPAEPGRPRAEAGARLDEPAEAGREPAAAALVPAALPPPPDHVGGTVARAECGCLDCCAADDAVDRCCCRSCSSWNCSISSCRCSSSCICCICCCINL